MTMIFRKLGKLFDPTTHRDFADWNGFAQSPQALVMDDRIRIFFSIRKADGSKFVSHVSFVDFTRDLQSIMGVAKQPVIHPASLGAFDEHGIFPFSPMRDGNRVMAYTCGWSRRVSVSVETAVGLAYSSDGGNTFFRHGTGPILTASLHEPFLVGDAFVRKFGGQYHMWYIFGTRWTRFPGEAEPDRVYKIGHAVSADGMTFEREGPPILPDRIDADECQALPTVIQQGNRYHMVFCFRHASGFRTIKGRGYRLGYAWSDDLTAWTRADEELQFLPADGDWDGEMMCYPHLFECDGRVYLLYNGNRFGREGFGAAVLES